MKRSENRPVKFKHRTKFFRESIRKISHASENEKIPQKKLNLTPSRKCTKVVSKIFKLKRNLKTTTIIGEQAQKLMDFVNKTDKSSKHFVYPERRKRLLNSAIFGSSLKTTWTRKLGHPEAQTKKQS